MRSTVYTLNPWKLRLLTSYMILGIFLAGAQNYQGKHMYKVLRGGRWQKINFERPGFRLNKRDRPSSFMASPWIQHLRSGSKSRVLASCSHLQDNVSSKEVSDQNFVDEEQGKKSVAVETPCNDEVIL
ncbi:hypothetical protein V6Z11_D01G135800 [Gossypium hirsutum]